MRLKARFQLGHITSQTAKYLPVVTALHTDIADAVNHLITRTPSATACYDLKRTILEHIEPSQPSTLRQIFPEEHGDLWPSQLPNRSSQLLGEHSSNESQLYVLHELFFQRLLQSARIALPVYDDMSRDQLAALAYRIYDRSPSVQLPIADARISELADRLSRLEETIDRITAALEQLTTRGNADGQLPRDHSALSHRIASHFKRIAFM